jgi:hypothetical protein
MTSTVLLVTNGDSGYLTLACDTQFLLLDQHPRYTFDDPYMVRQFLDAGRQLGFLIREVAQWATHLRWAYTGFAEFP